MMMPWKAVLEDDKWLIKTGDGQTIASMINVREVKTFANLMAASP